MYLQPTWAESQIITHGYEKGNLAHLQTLSNIADCISLSDLVDTQIRRNQMWELSNTFAALSTILPVSLLHTSNYRATFPQWFGKNSSTQRRQRLLSEVHSNTKTSISGSKEELRLQYFPTIQSRLTQPLINEGTVNYFFFLFSEENSFFFFVS